MNFTWTPPKPLPWWKRAWKRFLHVVTTGTWYYLDELLECELAKQIRAEIDNEIIAELTKLAKDIK